MEKPEKPINREDEIFLKMLRDGKSRMAISNEYGISRSRIDQIFSEKIRYLGYKYHQINPFCKMLTIGLDLQSAAVCKPDVMEYKMLWLQIYNEVN